MTIGVAHSHYMYMVRYKREEQLREALADAAYNLRFLEEHRQAEEQLDEGEAIAPGADMKKQGALLESYRSAPRSFSPAAGTTGVTRNWRTPRRSLTRRRTRCRKRAIANRTSPAPPRQLPAAMTTKSARPQSPSVTRKSSA